MSDPRVSNRRPVTGAAGRDLGLPVVGHSTGRLDIVQVDWTGPEFSRERFVTANRSALACHGLGPTYIQYGLNPTPS